MLSLILFFFTAFGLVYLVVDSTIMAPFRVALAVRSVLAEAFIYCAYCTGFWIGMALGAAFQAWVWDGWVIARNVVDAALNGAMVMGLIALIRGFTPAFLAGAWEREREIIAAVRRHRADVERVDGCDQEGHGGEAEGDGGASE